MSSPGVLSYRLPPTQIIFTGNATLSNTLTTHLFSYVIWVSLFMRPLSLHRDHSDEATDWIYSRLHAHLLYLPSSKDSLRNDYHTWWVLCLDTGSNHKLSRMSRPATKLAAYFSVQRVPSTATNAVTAMIYTHNSPYFFAHFSSNHPTA